MCFAFKRTRSNKEIGGCVQKWWLTKFYYTALYPTIVGTMTPLKFVFCAKSIATSPNKPLLMYVN